MFIPVAVRGPQPFQCDFTTYNTFASLSSDFLTCIIMHLCALEKFHPYCSELHTREGIKSFDSVYFSYELSNRNNNLKILSF